MKLSLSRWRAGHLLAAWTAYWAGLTAVTITPIVLALLRAARSGAGPGSSSMSASFGDAGISVTVTQYGKAMIERSAGFGAMAAWIAVPPLALWALWLYRRSCGIEAGEMALPSPPPEPAALGEPAPEWRAPSRGASRVER